MPDMTPATSTEELLKSSIFSTDTQEVRLIAFYLPQFHPVPENDVWWGKGFTEWTNVTKATPLFDGHYQPHLPTDFGFYDLRVRETRHDQIQVAKQYGIDGFCYHYYWFSGTRILDRPLDHMLSDPESKMPFCLCWANENWTRRWDAAEREILIEQRYLPEDDLNFIKSLVPFFLDPRYIRIEGAPFFVVYRPQHLPDPKRTSRIWRDYCKSIGIDKIHICAALTHGNEDYTQFDFDSGVEFPPHNLKVDNVSDQIVFYNPFKGNVMAYQDVARSYLDRSYTNPNVFKCVFPCWDNTARTNDRALIILNSTPNNYEYWLNEVVRKTSEDFPYQERFVFINAWNEWAEGCHLEPDRKYQRQFLDATLSVKTGSSESRGFDDVTLSSFFVQSRRTFINDLRAVFAYHAALSVGRLRLWVRRHPQIGNLIRKMRKVWKQKNV
jgi:lipopolysaccharide biosynthesis protein